MSTNQGPPNEGPDPEARVVELEGPRGVVHCDKVGAVVLVLVVTACVGGARLVGGAL
jgi:hypothetical protein